MTELCQCKHSEYYHKAGFSNCLRKKCECTKFDPKGDST